MALPATAATATARGRDENTVVNTAPCAGALISPFPYGRMDNARHVIRCRLTR